VSVFYGSSTGKIRALDDVSLSVTSGEFIAVVGESGCGKSTLALAIMRLLPPSSEIKGRIEFGGVDLANATVRELTALRGTKIGMIFQEPLESLNPIEKIGKQMAETIQIKRAEKKWVETKPIEKKSSSEDRLRTEIVENLREVRIADPEKTVDRYPFQLSGGMAQRVMIAMALSQKPSILIADEPTSALDVTTQAQIIQLMKDLAQATDTAIILITHDLGVAAQVADRVVVMYAGEIVEEGTAKQVFLNPLHPYTKALLRCYPNSAKSAGHLETIEGSVPDLRTEIRGCKFAGRCPHVKKICLGDKPPEAYPEMNHRVKCTLY
jgi:oligopeptide/dipeptide ABC transporter ATP-binding protein